MGGERDMSATPMEEEGPAEAAAAAPAPAPVGSGAGGDDTKVAAAPPAKSFDVRFQAAEKAVKECPDDYDANVKYIWYLRKLRNAEKLRAARENMHTRFPLTPKMWQEWMQDELSSLGTSNQTFGDIENLFERGVQEYLLINVWWHYLLFVSHHVRSVCSYSPAGLSKMRDLCERAISAGGLHVTEGIKIWAAYIAFETNFLGTIIGGNEEERAKQVQRIRTLFHRLLSVPLANTESILAAYKCWEAEQVKEDDQDSDIDGVPSNVICAYKKAMDMYNERKQYEDQLSNAGASEDDKVQEFLKYIKFEESKGDPARVQVLYERAVSDLPDSSDLWTEYTSYVDRSLKVPSVVKSVYYRATRQCPLVSELWVRYMLSLERIHASEKELYHVFDEATECSFDTFKERVDIYLTRMDSLRRRMSDGLNFHLIRETFRDAAGYPFSFLEAEDALPLCSYMAKLERNLGDGVAGARQVWEDALTEWGFNSQIWQHYISMEIEMGYINRARSLYKRCYSRRFSGSGSEDICNAWIRFEGEYGTLDDYDWAMRKVTRLKELLNSKDQQEAETDHYPVPSDSPQKRKGCKMTNEQEPSAKRRKENMPSSGTPSDDGLLGSNENSCSTPSNSDSDPSGGLEVLQKVQQFQQKWVDAAATKDDVRVIASRMERMLALQEEQLRVQQEVLRVQREQHEDLVMALDVDKVAPWAREYYINKQKQIAARASAGKADVPT